MSNKTKKLLILNLPYFIAGLVCTNLGEAWRIAEGADMSEKLLGFLSALGTAFSNPMPSLYPMDLLIGVCCGAGLRLAVYLKGKNAKKYRHGMEYGSARWGTQKDIEPFEDPVFANNVILTRTERLMMGNRPKNPANARNKNVLVVGGSGSGKTRFWLKPNLLQCHSSYVVTDPKGDMLVINALSAADHVLIPVQADYLAAEDMTELVGTVHSIRQQINPKLKIGGVFLTMANDTNFRKDIVAGVKENFGKHLPVLDAVIPATVRLAEISTADKSIFRHEPRGRAAAAYGALVKEVERIGEKQRIRDADITR